MSERVNLVESLAKTVDDLFDAVIGGRPVERLLDIAKSIAPANVARKIVGAAPGDLVDRAVAEVEMSIKSGTPPRPPRLEELVPMRR